MDTISYIDKQHVQECHSCMYSIRLLKAQHPASVARKHKLFVHQTCWVSNQNSGRFTGSSRAGWQWCRYTVHWSKLAVAHMICQRLCAHRWDGALCGAEAHLCKTKCLLLLTGSHVGQGCVWHPLSSPIKLCALCSCYEWHTHIDNKLRLWTICNGG